MMASAKTAPIHGMTADMSLCSSACFTIGVQMIPPTDKPVDAIDSAIDRRRWNQRVTTVMEGTRPHRAQPSPKMM